MGRALANIDLWGKGHRVTRGSGEFQRLAPLKQSATSSSLEMSMDRFEQWPSVLDSLHKAVPSSLSEQYCVLVTEHEVAVVVPHASRDAHERPSVIVVVAYVPIDWRLHAELVARIGRARSLCVRLGKEVAMALSGRNEDVSTRLRAGTFLPAEGHELSVERAPDQAFWEELMGGVARFRGITGVATPRMFALGANVIVGTRAEGQRAAADGFFDPRSLQLVSLGARLHTWQSESAKTSGTPAAPQNLDPDVATHLLELRDKLERVEATVEQVATSLDEVRADQSATRKARRNSRRGPVEQTAEWRPALRPWIAAPSKTTASRAG